MGPEAGRVERRVARVLWRVNVVFLVVMSIYLGHTQLYVDSTTCHLRRLTSSRWCIRVDAAKQLANRGGQVHRIVPRLVPLLNDPVANVRSAAAYALSEMMPEAREALPALTEASRRHPQLAVRLAMLDAVAAYGSGPEAMEALPHVAALMRKRDSLIASAAEGTLITLSYETPQALPLLIELVHDKATPHPTRHAVAAALGVAGRRYPDKVDALLAAADALPESDADLRAMIRRHIPRNHQATTTVAGHATSP